MTDHQNNSSDDDDEKTIGRASKLEEAARSRKRRLMEMKSRLSGVPMEVEDYEPIPQERDMKAQPVFRSYQPKTIDLGQIRTDDSKQLFAVEKEIGDHLAATLETEIVEKVDLSTLAPRKIDWDLKRDATPRLERLERRTQKAIAQLIRDRLASEGSNSRPEMLLTAVNSAIRSDLQQEMDD